MENINPDNLIAAKKRQNKITEYREMLQKWRDHGAITYAGYILGFPGDTKESILRDIEIIKRELPLDILEFFFLTPLPGSEDHKVLWQKGVWMDPDMNKYDLNHRVSHHPKMSDAEWEEAYRAAWEAYYTPEHVRTILRRSAACRLGRPGTTLTTILWFYLMIAFEGVHPLEGGALRLKFRRDRRHGLPRENPLLFYPRYVGETVVKAWRYWSVYRRFKAIARRSARRAGPLDLHRPRDRAAASPTNSRRSISITRPAAARPRSRACAATTRSVAGHAVRGPAGADGERGGMTVRRPLRRAVRSSPSTCRRPRSRIRAGRRRPSAATPEGVPVMMMSPAASSTISESLTMTSGTFQIICARSPSWRTLPLALSAMRPLLGMPDLVGGLQRPAGRRGVERLADLPRPLHVARGDLQVAPREVDADAVALDAVERLIELDVAAARLERDHQLDLVVHVLGERRIGHGRAIRHDGVGGLGEEERRVAHVVAHLADVLLVVAADAPDAAHRKRLVGAGHRDGGLRRRRDDVALERRTLMMSLSVTCMNSG